MFLANKQAEASRNKTSGVYLSDKDAKQRKAPSETCASSCLSNVDNDSTHDGNEESCGSILVHKRDTTDIAECKVSLWMAEPLSRMNERTQFRPPASNTAPASRVQMSSSTYVWKSTRHW